MDIPAAFESCGDLVRRADPDRYFSALFAPSALRPYLFALHAFNHEIARIATSVREPMLGEIRLQWWRETLESARAGHPRAHDVARALAVLFARIELPPALFEAMIDARSFDFSAETFADFAALDAYLNATSGNLMRLAARILGAGDAHDELAREAGIAYGLSGILRSFAFHTMRGKSFFPVELLHLVGLNPATLETPEARDKLEAVFHQVALRARDRLAKARALPRPKKALAAFLPASLVPFYLRRAMRAGFDPFNRSADGSLPRRQMALLGAAMRGRI